PAAGVPPWPNPVPPLPGKPALPEPAPPLAGLVAPPALGGAPPEGFAPPAAGEPAAAPVAPSLAALQAETPTKKAPRMQRLVAIRLVILVISLSNKMAHQQAVDVMPFAPGSGRAGSIRKISRMRSWLSSNA